MRKEFLTAQLEPEKAVDPLSWSHCAPCTDSTSLPGGPTALHSLSVLPPPRLRKLGLPCRWPLSCGDTDVVIMLLVAT